MSKRVIITKKQLDEICGGDSSYLDGLSTKPDVPSNMYANQVTVSGGMEKEYPKPVTGDDVQKRMSRDAGMFGSGRITNRGMSSSIYYESKEPDNEIELVVEVNSELKGQNITAVIGSGDEKYKVSGSEGKLAMQKTRALQNGDVEKAKALDKALKARREPIAQRKKNKKNMGIENAYQKSGGTKQSGNGRAHTKKNDNITYFN